MTSEEEDFFGDEPTPRRTPPEPARPVAPEPPRPAGSRGQPVRAVVLAVVLVVGVAVGVVDHVVHRAAAAPPPPIAVATVPPAGVESSAWYCAGATSTAGTTGAMTINLTNTTGRPVDGTLRAVSEVRAKNGTLGPGRGATAGLVVPADDEVTEVPGTLVGGDFVAATVSLSGGGVLATQSVAGPLGWSESSCSRSTAAHWYFASGATEKGDTLYLALYNPTTTEAVVDTTFVTPSQTTQPVPFEGIVVPAGALVTEEIDSYVQDASSVSGIVTARAGAVVAAELEARASGPTGLSVRMGVPQPESAWAVPSSTDVAGGTTSISVFNPTSGTDRVAVRVRPVPRGVPTTFTSVIGPKSTWVLTTSAQTRIPTGLAFLATVRVLRGPGVVVDRAIAAPAKAPSPGFGSVTAVPLTPLGPRSVVAGPGDATHPPVPKAAIDALNLANLEPVAVTATVWALEGAAGRVRLATVTIPARSTDPVGGGIFGANTRTAVEVSASGRVAVSEDMTPAAVGGVVSLGGAPSG